MDRVMIFSHTHTPPLPSNRWLLDIFCQSNFLCEHPYFLLNEQFVGLSIYYGHVIFIPNHSPPPLFFNSICDK